MGRTAYRTGGVSSACTFMLRRMQQVAVDRMDGSANSGAVFLLGEAVKETLADRRRSQRWLAEALGMDDGNLSRILKGTGVVTLDLVRRVEDLLELDKGDLLRRGGYVSESVTSEQAIATDTRLSDRARRALLESYRVMAQ